MPTKSFQEACNNKGDAYCLTSLKTDFLVHIKAICEKLDEGIVTLSSLSIMQRYDLILDLISILPGISKKNRQSQNDIDKVQLKYKAEDSIPDLTEVRGE